MVTTNSLFENFKKFMVYRLVLSYYLFKNIKNTRFYFSENITTCLANIHSFALRDCKQMPWAGILANEIPMVQVSLFEKRKGEQQLRHKNVKMPNLPYSKSILLEHIRYEFRKENRLCCMYFQLDCTIH